MLRTRDLYFKKLSFKVFDFINVFRIERTDSLRSNFSPCTCVPRMAIGILFWINLEYMPLTGNLL